MLMLLLAALTLPAAPPGSPEPAHEQAPQARPAPDTDRTIAVQKGARLVLDNQSGEIVVRGWDRDEVRLQARHAPRTTVRIRQTPAVLTLSATAERGPAGGVDYELTVPRWMTLKLSGLGAYIEVENVQGEISADTMRGDVVLRGVSGPVTASSFQGEVLVERSTGRVQASAVNRGVVISDAAGDIVAESISGGVRLSGIRSRSVEASAISGGIELAGDIAAEGSYRLVSHSGSIVVRTRSLDATVTVRSFSGRFQSAFQTEQIGSPRRGQAATHVAGAGRARMTLETFSGNISIRHPE